MEIFNRWGDKVYEQLNFAPNDENFGWDGKFRGQYVNPDVFVYRIEVKYLDERTEVFRGDLTILR